MPCSLPSINRKAAKAEPKIPMISNRGIEFVSSLKQLSGLVLPGVNDIFNSQRNSVRRPSPKHMNTWKRNLVSIQEMHRVTEGFPRGQNVSTVQS
mmetsp:Transcript_28963/g.46717  ORF Transcript_28963/g.46717 Transcript_28963/m.46717 type:complete len:95 (+) Transcript_28963:360-644(+)